MSFKLLCDAKRLTGRCSSGLEADGGSLHHAVYKGSKFGKALCGAKPGARSNGWSDYVRDVRDVNCVRCLKKMGAL